jgi:hypothetical protein
MEKIVPKNRVCGFSDQSAYWSYLVLQHIPNDITPLLY